MHSLECGLEAELARWAAVQKRNHPIPNANANARSKLAAAQLVRVNGVVVARLLPRVVPIEDSDDVRIVEILLWTIGVSWIQKTSLHIARLTPKGHSD